MRGVKLDEPYPPIFWEANLVIHNNRRDEEKNFRAASIS